MEKLEVIDNVIKKISTVRDKEFCTSLEYALKQLILGEYGYCIEKVYAYGSFARGDYRNDSDIDLLVCCNDKFTKEIAQHLRSSVMWLGFPEIDLKFVTRNSQWYGGLFAENIRKDGALLWKRE